LLLDPPVKITETDYLVLESTYGDREHPKTPTDVELAQIVNAALRKKGNLIIPTFAVERAQEIMFILNTLREKNMIPKSVPIYLDSPMGIDATEVMMKYPKWHKLSSKFCHKINHDIIKIRELMETKNVIKEKNPKIIIAGSGMLSGGRALEYLKAYVEDERTIVLFVGFQAEGTRGRAMLRGTEQIRIHGKYYYVNAEVKEISSFSGHADRTEIMQWLSNFSKTPKKIFLNHGELRSAEALRILIEEKMNCECTIPLLNDTIFL
jgi:metallo-beta-lactamase family protein